MSAIFATWDIARPTFDFEEEDWISCLPGSPSKQRAIFEKP
jgi:hypothetical protein